MGYYVDFELQIQNVDKAENLGESVAELCPDLVDSVQYNGGIAEDEVKSGFVAFNSKWKRKHINTDYKILLDNYLGRITLFILQRLVDCPNLIINR